jgi:outer membrane protein assembly factor BamB
MRTLSSLGLVLTMLVGAPSPLPATDEWPQFRGPDGQGHTLANLPLTWSETANVAWKCPDPGQGWSSPVVSGNQIWMTTATESGRSLRVLCVDLATGKLIKNMELFHRDKPIAIQPENSYATPTPVVEAGRLYVSFGACGTACLSTDTAAVHWRREDLCIDHEVGPSSSPIVARGLLIIPFDGKDIEFVIALDKANGRTVWQANRSFVDGKRPYPAHSCCTPLMITVDGGDQVIVPGAQRTFAYELATGRELWWITHRGWSVVPRPLFGNGLVYTTTGWVPSGSRPTLLAIRPDGAGDVTESKIAWRLSRDVPMMASPVLVGDRLFAVTDDGTTYCLDARTGAELWRERIRGKFSASLLTAPGRVYAFDRDGTTTVFEATNTFHLLATNKLDCGCMASPAVVGRALILRTKTHLYRIEP